MGKQVHGLHSGIDFFGFMYRFLSGPKNSEWSGVVIRPRCWALGPTKLSVHVNLS